MALIQTKHIIIPEIPVDLTPEMSTWARGVQEILKTLSKDVRTDTDTLKTDIDDIVTTKGTINTHSISSDYTILDNDGYELFLVDVSSKDVTLTIPTLADNLERKISAKIVTGGGSLIVDGEGSETLDDYTSLALREAGNYIELVGTSGKWAITKLRCTMQSGGINTNDWTNRHLGTIELVYDNLAGTYVLGEIVAEYSDSGRTTATGKRGRITKVDGSTKLMLKDVESGGTFTNNYYLKGLTSLATADVNGATKNADTYFYHGWGANLNKIKIDLYISTLTTFSWTDALLAREASYFYDSVNEYWVGVKPVQIDTNNVNNQTGATYGPFIISTAGITAGIVAQEYSYNIVAELLI